MLVLQNGVYDRWLRKSEIERTSIFNYTFVFIVKYDQYDDHLIIRVPLKFYVVLVHVAEGFALQCDMQLLE